MRTEEDMYFKHHSSKMRDQPLTINCPMQSQLDPLPRDLPFRIISKTIGRGAYAS